MRFVSRRARTVALVAALLVCAPVRAQPPSAPIDLQIDLRDTPRRVLHATLSLPSQPGPLTLLYPKWIPGEHSPSGPIADLVGLRISANGRSLPWSRDSLDLYAIRVDVPDGANRVDVAVDYLPPNEASFLANPVTSTKLAIVSWNTMLLYPKGQPIRALQFRPAVVLPEGWQFATALTEERREGRTVHFAPVSLETLVDSPLAAGRHYKLVELTGEAPVPHRLHLLGDSDAALGIDGPTEQAFRRLVAEGLTLFGGYHYGKYDFLLSLSDRLGDFGLEHHESSDNRAAERALLNPAMRYRFASLLPHEFVHSWNGKYRRPFSLVRDDFQQPEEGDLLWIYEGLTGYLGDIVLTGRSGLLEAPAIRDALALMAAQQGVQRGRSWRPLIDTARSAQILFESRADGASWRRDADFYDEGALIWLEVDALIRSKSRDRLSLDDFCRAFFGGGSNAPRVVPYDYDELLRALDAVVEHDWRAFFEERVYSVHDAAPTGGFEAAGWRLVYTTEPNVFEQSDEEVDGELDLRQSLGFLLKVDDSEIIDVVPGSPADAAGVPSASTLIGINGRKWSPDVLEDAIGAAKASAAPIRMLLEVDDTDKAVTLEYGDGERHPHLERIPDRPDRLSRILAPRSR